MDSLLVDLDKVLDDFEAEESLVPGNERKPSGFQEYLKQSDEQSWKLVENSVSDPRFEDKSVDIADKGLNVRYDFPYEPEKFDLSEADFAPSPNVGNNAYNGDLVYDCEKQTDGDLKANSQINGTVNDIDKNLQNQYDLSSTGSSLNVNNVNVVKNDLKLEKLKLPVQADYPDSNPNTPTNPVNYMNGYGSANEFLLPKQSNTDVTDNQSVSLASIPSSASMDSNLDYDKYPVQCNTPQTPKDLPLVNPLDCHLAMQGHTSDAANNKQNISQSAEPGAAISSQSNTMQVLQDIPQLQNLKNDLAAKSQNTANVNLNQIDAHMLKTSASSTCSLPASFENQLMKNNLNNSLPTELTADQQTFMVDNKNENTSNLEVMNNHSQGYVTTDQIMGLETAQQLKLGFEQHCNKNVAVGFNMEEHDHVDEEDLNEYLGDAVAELNPSGNALNGDGNSNLTSEQQNDETVAVSGELNIKNKEHDESDLKPDSSSEMDTNEQPVVSSKTTDEVMNTVTDTAASRTESYMEEKSDIGVNEGKNIRKPEESVFKKPVESDLEILKILPTNVGELAAPVNPKTVISNLDTNLSPSANLSLDSGCASMTDNNTPENSGIYSHVGERLDVGARPKDMHGKVNRPNTLMGLSKVNLNSDSPFVVRSVASPSMEQVAVPEQTVQERLSPKMQTLVNNEKGPNVVEDSRQLMETGGLDTGVQNVSDMMETDVNLESENHEPMTNENAMDTSGDLNTEEVELRRPSGLYVEGGTVGRPHSWSPSDTGQPQMQKQKRPTSLNLPPQPTFNPNNDRSHMMVDSEASPEEGAEASGGADVQDVDPGLCTGGAEGYTGEEEHAYIPQAAPHEDLGPPPPYSSNLGKVAPKWVPDGEAPTCMSCDVRFTFTKRRHHCRACGKIFCSTCCSMKSRLHYLNQDARVCVQCHSELAIAESYEASLNGVLPHPNNPSDYCSVVPPSQAANSNAPVPSVLVPVLKRDGNDSQGHVRPEGSNRRSGEPKQVMFSDGIRPGGDLTELDGRSEITRVPPRRSRVQKRVERTGHGGQHSPKSRRLRTVSDRSSKCLIPENGLPPLSVPLQEGAGHSLQLNPDPETFMPKIKDEESEPVIFAVNTNLYVMVKILNLDCCVNRVVWSFTTRGMTSVGQEELVIVLETLPDENTVPKDIFTHLNNVFEDASKGTTITALGHSIFNQSFLGSREHGGFLYIRATFQCVQKLTLPSPPYLFGILLQKWETPWAKVFPIRLLLRLGAEYRYYPCPLIGVRNRKPVFFEIGHTIMNLLADFRNFQYMLPNIKGISIHMEDKVTKINFPRNRYEDLMKVVNNSNEHVMAIGATFSPDADSHLVCIQNDDGNYQTQAINIQNKPRKVTGASFVVFNGALKTSSGLSAKSSIVEDGLMVQITPDSMLALKQAIKDMQTYTITCGVIGAPKPDETVMVQWTDDDKNVNIGVKSPIDGMSMDGVESLHIQNSADYLGEKHMIRWTEIYFIRNEDSSSVKWEPVDLSRLGETLATACCVALTPHLQKLTEASLTKIGLRVTLGADNVGYESGAKGERLPDVYMNDLDNELIPVIHRATQHEGSIVLELIFQVLD